MYFVCSKNLDFFVDNRRGLLWPGSQCQNNETAESHVLLVKKILSSVVYNAL